jgi:hypothetical protein
MAETLELLRGKIMPDCLTKEVLIPVIAFTCTRWGTLLKGHPNWQEAPPTAADCYRYVLGHEAVSLALQPRRIYSSCRKTWLSFQHLLSCQQK